MTFVKGGIPWNKGQPRSPEVRAKIGRANRGRARDDVRGDKNPRWAGDGIGYSGAHRRLYTRRGPAMAYVCELCEERPARHWALRHDEGVSGPVLYAMDGLAYSINPDDYLPACVRCHSRFDRESA